MKNFQLVKRFKERKDTQVYWQTASWLHKYICCLQERELDSKICRNYRVVFREINYSWRNTYFGRKLVTTDEPYAYVYLIHTFIMSIFCLVRYLRLYLSVIPSVKPFRPSEFPLCFSVRLFTPVWTGPSWRFRGGEYTDWAFQRRCTQPMWKVNFGHSWLNSYRLRKIHPAR